MKKMMLQLLLMILCLMMIVPTSVAETREGVIMLEGMEETVEETLFESGQGFSFWYVNDTLKAAYYEDDDIDGVVINTLYSDDQMVISIISEEEIDKYAGNYPVNIKELSQNSSLRIELYDVLKDGKYSFGTLIAEKGRYCLAYGTYSMEAAEGNAKYFQRVLDSFRFLHPDEFVGHYSNDNYDEVIVAKTEDGYTMNAGLYRLTSLDDGPVSFLGEKLIFHATDANGNPMTLSFYQDDTEKYVLRVDESVWPLLEAGTVFENMVKLEEGNK